MPAALIDQKRVSDPLEFELRRVVSHRVDAGNQTPVGSSGQVASALNS